jgi:hypothetical protein
MNNLFKILEESKGAIKRRQNLTEEDLWSKHGAVIWKADRFKGSPSFYPVYRYKNLYSYSLLSLILFKGCLHLNPCIGRKVSKQDWLYLSADNTIDRKIVRIGGPLKSVFTIKDLDEFARRLSEALRHDISAVEAMNHGYTNIILCGGKDSLNLLLLPWKNPVVVASAQPNYDFVKTFITNNGLNYDLMPLEDHDNSLFDVEILINCCRNNLEHSRWGYHLVELSRTFENKVVFWKGQLGDTFMTPYWKNYIPHTKSITTYLLRIVSRLSRYCGNVLEKTNLLQRYFFRSLWYRGAMWQGAHMAFIRQLTNSLVLSGYHGPAVQKVISEVELKSAVQEDVRPLVGKYLYGRAVFYPDANPGPPSSKMRKGISHLGPFLKTLNSIHIPVR